MLSLLVVIGHFEATGEFRQLTVKPGGTDDFSTKTYSSKDSEEDVVDSVVYFDEIITNDRLKKEVKVWDHWGKWSPCTVTCGEGKMTRWRHCVSEACEPGEKEAEIKTCKRKPC